MNLLDPQAIVLGGYFAPLAAAPGARPPRRSCAAACSAPAAALPDLITSPLGPEAAVRGAASLALARLVDDPGMLAEDGHD